MGDLRYDRPFHQVLKATDPAAIIRTLSDADVIAALAAASRAHEPLLANVLATEAQNRALQKEAILRLMGDGVYTVDRNGVIRSANPQFAQLVGRAGETLVGQDVHQITSCVPEGLTDRSRSACPVLQTIERNEQHECDVDYERPDGSKSLLAIIAVPLRRDDDTENEGAVVVVRDVEVRRRAEAAAQRLAAIVRSSDEAIIGKTPDGFITEWNPAAERLFGYSAAEITGRHVNLIVPPDLQAEEARLLEKAALGQRVERYDTRRLTRHARAIEVAVSLSPVMRDGHIESLAAVYADITEQKRIERVLQEARDFHASILDGFPIPVWRTSIEASCDYLNPAWLDFTGRPADDQYGSGWLALVHPEDRERVSAEYLTAFKKRQKIKLSYRLRRHDGTWRWMLNFGSPYHDARGEFAGYVGTCYDDTERRQIEAELRKTEDRFLLAARATNDVIWDFDLAEERLWWSENLLALLGYREQDAPATLDDWAGLVHPDDRARVLESMDGWIIGRQSEWTEEYRIRRRNGTYAHVRDRGVALRSKEGMPTRILGSITDITADKQMESRYVDLLDAERAARTAAEARLAIWIPSLLWGAGVAVFLPMLVVALARIMPQLFSSDIVFEATLLATLLGLLVGAVMWRGLHYRHVDKERRSKPPPSRPPPS